VEREREPPDVVKAEDSNKALEGVFVGYAQHQCRTFLLQLTEQPPSSGYH
jgi:hypothetical protein